MNTTEVIITLARKLDISQAAARKLLKERLTEISRALVEKESIDLPGLGTIQVKETRVRRQYIPGKHSHCLIPAHKRPVFKVNSLFKARLKRLGP